MRDLLLAALLMLAPLTSRALPLDSLLARVRAHHPLVRQAALAADAARSEERAARGAFDPVISASWDRKAFGGASYFDYSRAKLTLPTPLGADVVFGAERSRGRYVSPDRRTPDAGLFSLGIALPLGQRLVSDERRAAIATTRALRSAADADRALVLARALMEATRDYARWYESERRLDAAREGESLAAFRLDAVRRRVAAGEAAAIDTVEAALEVQRRRVARMESEQGANTTRLAVALHYWGADGAPESLPAQVRPTATIATVALDSAAIVSWVALAESAHPEVVRAESRRAADEAQRAYLGWQRLPALDVELSALGTDAAELESPALGSSKVGATLKLPLLLRKERGKAGAAAAKVAWSGVEASRVRLGVALAVRRAAADVGFMDDAIAAQRDAVAQSRRLLDAERRRYDGGEGTLFLVNARERALLDEVQKLASLEARRLAAWGELRAATAR